MVVVLMFSGSVKFDSFQVLTERVLGFHDSI